MMAGRIVAGAAVEFASAREAERAVAGVPAAARIVRELMLAGYAEVWIALGSGESLSVPVLTEIGRLANDAAVRIAAPPPDIPRLPGSRLIAAADISAYLAGKAVASLRLDSPDANAEILRGADKASDGIVSRWLNRPISRRLSALLLQWPGMRPIHATAGTALLAVLMFAALLFGGHDGLIAGALLFHAASVFDGVDGEIARATFRTSPAGAALDSAIDLATNIAAMLGLAINLSLRGDPAALPLASFGLALLLLGTAMIGWRSWRQEGSFNFDWVKHRYRGWFAGLAAARAMRLATLGTSRDFCALVYLVLALAGLPIAGLYLFAVVTPVWIAFVVLALWPPRVPPEEAENPAA